MGKHPPSDRLLQKKKKRKFFLETNKENVQNDDRSSWSDCIRCMFINTGKMTFLNCFAPLELFFK